MPALIANVTINLLADPPKQGNMQVNFRCSGPDKFAIDHAANAVGMNQATFLRYIAVLGAREVLRQRDELKAKADSSGSDAQVEEVARMDEVNPGADNHQD